MEPIENKKPVSFIVRQLESWGNAEDGWDCNNVWVMGTMKTKAQNERRALTKYLARKHGIVFRRNRTRIEFDGDNYTIVDRTTGEPLFDALYVWNEEE